MFNDRTTVLAAVGLNPDELRNELSRLRGAVRGQIIDDDPATAAGVDRQLIYVDASLEKLRGDLAQCKADVSGDERHLLEVVAWLVTERVVQSAQLEAAEAVLDALSWTHFDTGQLEPGRKDGNALAYLEPGCMDALTICQEVHPDDGTDEGFRAVARGDIFVGCPGEWRHAEEATEARDVKPWFEE